jgi:tetratricopeptide (TPR) repeat protein
VDVPAALAALRASSLIGEAPVPDGEPRFSMLETIREYAAERLVAGGEEAELRGRHAAYFLALAEAAEPYVPGLRQGPWLDRMEREHDNLRAALAWALAEDTGETATRLAGALWPFWHERLYFDEGTRWLRAVEARGDRLPAGLRAPVLLGTLCLTFSKGDFNQCVALGEEVLAAWQDRGDVHGLALVRLYQALTRQNLGDVAAARAHYEQSLAHWRAAGDPYGRILSLSHLAFMLAEYAQFAEADRYFDEALALAERHDDRANIARSYIDRGLAVMMQGRFAPARELLREGLARSRAQRHAPNTTAALTYLGLATLLDNDPAEAFDYLAEALRLRGEAGDKLGMIYCLIGIAGVAGRQAQPVRAARLCAAATALQQAIGTHIPPGPGALYERELRAVQAQLDEAAFAAAWAEGQDMSLGEAVAYALGEAS